MQYTFLNSIVDKPGLDIWHVLVIHSDDFIFHVFVNVLQISLKNPNLSRTMMN
jgi:hypothetical protein